MSESSTIQATRRDGTGTRAARKLRTAGRVPGILYGHGEVPIPLALNEPELRSLLRHGAHALIDLAVDGKNETVVIKELQYDHLGSAILHVDFARVSADERVQITVPIVLRGSAPGVAAGGILEHQMHDVEIECAASNLVEQIVVNVKDLQLEGEITVADLTLPPGATPLVATDRVVVRITKASDEKEEAATAEATGAEPELIRREKEDEEPEAK